MTHEDAIDSCIAQIAGMVHDRGKLINLPPRHPRYYYACDLGPPGRDESAYIKATWEGHSWKLEPITEEEYCEAVQRPDVAPPGGDRIDPATTVPPPRDRLPEGSLRGRIPPGQAPLCTVKSIWVKERALEGPIRHKSLFD